MSMRALIHNCISNRLLKVYTSMPAVIVSYDSDSQLAQVKPLAMIQKESDKKALGPMLPEDRGYEEIDVVFNVMVQQPSCNNGNTFIHMPIKKGDLGMLNVCCRSLENYTLNKGDKYKVEDYRNHDISDSYFVPGVLPKGKSLNVDNGSDLFIKHGSTLFQMDSSGKFKFQGGALSNIELLQIIEDLINTLLTTTVATMAGPQNLSSALLPPGVPGSLADMLTQIMQIKKG